MPASLNILSAISLQVNDCAEEIPNNRVAAFALGVLESGSDTTLNIDEIDGDASDSYEQGREVGKRLTMYLPLREESPILNQKLLAACVVGVILEVREPMGKKTRWLKKAEDDCECWQNHTNEKLCLTNKAMAAYLDDKEILKISYVLF